MFFIKYGSIIIILCQFFINNKQDIPHRRGQLMYLLPPRSEIQPFVRILQGKQDCMCTSMLKLKPYGNFNSKAADEII